MYLVNCVIVHRFGLQRTGLNYVSYGTRMFVDVINSCSGRCMGQQCCACGFYLADLVTLKGICFDEMVFTDPS